MFFKYFVSSGDKIKLDYFSEESCTKLIYFQTKKIRKTNSI